MDAQRSPDMNVKSVAHYQKFGHGHVIKRPDGVRSRCGGPRLCKQCRREEAALAAQSVVTPECGHPVLVDSQKQPGVNVYVCARCDAEVRLMQFEVRRPEAV